MIHTLNYEELEILKHDIEKFLEEVSLKGEETVLREQSESLTKVKDNIHILSLGKKRLAKTDLKFQTVNALDNLTTMQSHLYLERILYKGYKDIEDRLGHH